MRTSRIIQILPFLLALLACDRFDATRHFNHGLRAFQDEKYQVAVQFFSRASEALPNRATRYNLALAHLAWLRALSSADKASAADLDPDRISAALAAVHAARELPELDDEMLAKLGYIEGAIHALAGNQEAAREAFMMSLAAVPDFEPTLKALLPLETEADTTATKLLAATAVVEPLEPEETLAD